MCDVVMRLFTEAGLTPRIRHEVGETSTLVTLVAGGLGLAVVPQPVSAPPLDGVTCLPLVRPVTTITLAIAHRAHRAEPHMQRTLTAISDLVRMSNRAIDDGTRA
ncbi:LysR substrate-binding domain-containing protein [Saccharothrix sp. HUAS TT1]|uniref:LysR substrate-binding domain-containing protein n=1 Tax=unclassified Saccharothrix TaxID=2593673 RepID=UPI00345C0854